MKKYDNEKGLVVWITGLPCSGKTTISKEIAKYLEKKGKKVQLLDGDVLRSTINSDLGFSKKDRNENIKRVVYIARMLSGHKINVVVAFVSPYQEMRENARKICPNFIEVYLKCSLEKCKNRDVKGMYKKALKGEIKDFTGVQDRYEIPNNPEIILNTDKNTLKESLSQFTNYLERYVRE